MRFTLSLCNWTLMFHLLKSFQTSFCVVEHVAHLCLPLAASYGATIRKRRLCMLASFPCLSLLAVLMHILKAGRVVASRTFFTLNILGLIFSHGAATFTTMDDLVVPVFKGQWSFHVSNGVIGAIQSLLIFGLKNLVAAVLWPGALAVSKSALKSLKLDAAEVASLKAAHCIVLESGALGRNQTSHRIGESQ